MKSSFSYDERREWAKTLYTKQDAPIKEVAATVGADEVIVRSWIQEGRWDEIKRSLLISRAAQLERFYSAIDSIYQEAKDKGVNLSIKDVDLINKYTTSIKNLEAETAVCYIVQVAEMFTSWLLRKDAALAQMVTAQFDAFITDQDTSRPKPIF